MPLPASFEHIASEKIEITVQNLQSRKGRKKQKQI